MASYISLGKYILLTLFLGVIMFSSSACKTKVEVTHAEEENIDVATVEGQLASRLNEVLSSLAQRETTVTTEEISGAISKTGLDASDLEIQESTTPTGLQADSITLALPSGDKCVFGYIREKNVATAVLPKLENGKCFVGKRQS